MELPEDGSLGVDFQYANRIGGGVFGGDKDAVSGTQSEALIACSL